MILEQTISTCTFKERAITQKTFKNILMLIVTGTLHVIPACTKLSRGSHDVSKALCLPRRMDMSQFSVFHILLQRTGKLTAFPHLMLKLLRGMGRHLPHWLKLNPEILCNCALTAISMLSSTHNSVSPRLLRNEQRMFLTLSFSMLYSVYLNTITTQRTYDNSKNPFNKHINHLYMFPTKNGLLAI